MGGPPCACGGCICGDGKGDMGPWGPIGWPGMRGPNPGGNCCPGGRSPGLTCLSAPGHPPSGPLSLQNENSQALKQERKSEIPFYLNPTSKQTSVFFLVYSFKSVSLSLTHTLFHALPSLSLTHTFTPSHTLSFSHTHTLSLTHTFIISHTLFHIHTHPLTHCLSHTHSFTHTLSHTHTFSLSHTLFHMYTYTHTLSHRHTDTDTDTDTHILAQAPLSIYYLTYLGGTPWGGIPGCCIPETHNTLTVHNSHTTH